MVRRYNSQPPKLFRWGWLGHTLRNLGDFDQYAHHQRMKKPAEDSWQSLTYFDSGTRLRSAVPFLVQNESENQLAIQNKTRKNQTKITLPKT